MNITHVNSKSYSENTQNLANFRGKVYTEAQSLIQGFKENLKIKNYSPRSIASYEYCLNKFFHYLENKQKSLKEITKDDIVNYASSLKQKGYGEHTIERDLYSIKGFFKYLEQTLYILINPANGLILRKVPQRLPVILTENEITRILNTPNTSTVTGIRDRAMLEVLYSTGIRLYELHNLTIFDIDTSSGFLRVNKGKFSKDRFVPLTKISCFYLKQYINEVRPRFTKNKPKENALFVGERGNRINKTIIQRLIKDYTKKAGIKKKITTHTFRHTFATHLSQNDVDIFKIQRLLGHSRPSITQIYTQLNPKQIKETHKRCHPREKDKE